MRENGATGLFGASTDLCKPGRFHSFRLGPRRERLFPPVRLLRPGSRRANLLLMTISASGRCLSTGAIIHSALHRSVEGSFTS
jgi:hypothetical protein